MHAADGRRQVVVMDLAPLGKPRGVGFVDLDVTSVAWINEDRLV